MVLSRRVFGLRYEGHFFDEEAWRASAADIAALRTHGSAEGWQCRLPERTLVVSLTPSEEDVLAGFAARARASVRSAARTVSITWAETPEERAAFYRAYGDFAARRGLLAPDPAEETGLDLLLARDRDGALLQAAAFLPARGVGIYRYRYGVALRKSQANAGILFEAMRRAKSLGFPLFDLGGITPGARPGSHEAGITFFKSQFGGREVEGTLYLRGRTASLRAALRLLSAASPLFPLLPLLRDAAIRVAGRGSSAD